MTMDKGKDSTGLDAAIAALCAGANATLDARDAAAAKKDEDWERFLGRLEEQREELREVEAWAPYCDYIRWLFANMDMLLYGAFPYLAKLSKRSLSPEQKERCTSLTAEVAMTQMIGARTRRDILKILAELRHRPPDIVMTFALFGETLKYGALATKGVALYYETKGLCEELGDKATSKEIEQRLDAQLDKTLAVVNDMQATMNDMQATMNAMRDKQDAHDAETRTAHQEQAEAHQEATRKLTDISMDTKKQLAKDNLRQPHYLTAGMIAKSLQEAFPSNVSNRESVRVAISRRFADAEAQKRLYPRVGGKNKTKWYLNDRKLFDEILSYCASSTTIGELVSDKDKESLSQVLLSNSKVIE